MERRIELQNLQVGSMQYVSRHMDMSIDQDEVRDMLVYSLRSYVLAQKLVGDVQEATYQVPRSAWQMWKERHARAWFLRWRPVRYETRTVAVRFERYATYPDAGIEFPNSGPMFLYERFEQVR